MSVCVCVHSRAWSVGFMNFPLLVDEVDRRPMISNTHLHLKHTRYYYYFSIHITVAPEIKIRDYSVNNMISSEERSSSVMNERTVRSHHVKSREMLLRKYSRVKYELSMAHKNTLIPWCELVFGINQTDYMKRCV